MIRLLRVFSIAADFNKTNHRILHKLTVEIEKKLHEIDENDVLQLLRSYEYLEGDITGSGRLF